MSLFSEDSPTGQSQLSQSGSTPPNSESSHQTSKSRAFGLGVSNGFTFGQGDGLSDSDSDHEEALFPSASLNYRRVTRDHYLDSPQRVSTPAPSGPERRIWTSDRLQNGLVAEKQSVKRRKRCVSR